MRILLGLLLIGAAGCGQIDGFAVSRGSQTQEFLYIGNYGASTISIYQLSDGSLIQSANTIPTSQGTDSVSSLLVSSSGSFLYATEHGSADISQFSIAPMSAAYPAAASPITGINPIVAGAGTSQIVANPAFTYAYVANAGASGNNINEYSIEPVSGALKAIGAAAAKVSPVSLIVEPTGQYLYVANSGSSDISGFTIGTDGTLVSMGTPLAIGQNTPTWIITDPSGKFVYTTCSGSDSVAVFTIGAAGALSATTPATFATGASPNAIAFTPDGLHAFVANKGASSVSAYSVNASTGALTQINGSPFGLFGGSTNPYALLVDPSGKYLVVSNQGSGDVSVFSINTASGVLKGVGSPVAMGLDPQSLAFVTLTQGL